MEVRPRNRLHRPGHAVTCYYCTAVLQQSILREHMEQCPDVLICCPNKCGMTVKRALLHNHLIQECVSNNSSYVEEKSNMDSSRIQLQKSAKSRVMPSKETLNTNERAAEAKNNAIQNLKLDIYGIGKDIGSLDQELHLLRSCILDKQEQTKSWVQEQLNRIQIEVQHMRISVQQQQEDQLHIEIALQNSLEEKLSSQAQELRFETNRLLKTCHAEIEACRLQLIQEIQRIQQELDEKHISEINQLQCKFSGLKEYTNKCHQELKEFRQFLSEENVIVSGVWKETLESVKELSDKIKKLEKLTQNELDEFHIFLSKENAMISGVWMDLKINVKKVEEKLDKLEEKVNTQHKEMAQLRQNVTDCIEGQNADHCTTPNDGHMIWKISNFEEKLDDAKKNNTVLHSPMFYSSPFGYKLRVQLRLNGIGQWTGRHMIASLQVLEGEWDPIQPSSFNQRVTLTLRDQCKPPYKPQNLEKSLVEGKKKEEPSGLHVFIPHTILKQHNYILNNTIFLEIHAHSSRNVEDA